MKQLLIIGASGHGKVVADIAKCVGYDDICFLDDNNHLAECSGYPVVGTTQRFSEYNCDMIVAVGNAAIRQRIQEQLQAEGKSVATLVHPNAVVGEQVMIGVGSVVMAGAVINPCASVGQGCIVNTCASVDHDCVVEDYAHISVGAHLAGTVKVGCRTWVGIGAVVSNNLNVAADCTIGAGAVVVKNIEERGTYVGCPARQIR